MEDIDYFFNSKCIEENDYSHLFTNCTHININKEKGEPSIPSVQDITTDGFDWDKDFNEAYNIK